MNKRFDRQRLATAMLGPAVLALAVRQTDRRMVAEAAWL
jgi:hypothetical protein